MLDQTTGVLVHFDGGALCDALRRCKPAISKEETRYYLNGIFMHYDSREKMVRFVSTDGHRLCHVEVKATDDYSMMPAVILPPKFVAAVIKAAGKRRDCWKTFSFEVLPAKVTLYTQEGRKLAECVPVDGTYPDYQRVIPRGEPELGKITLPRKTLMAACAALASFREAAEDCQTIKLAFEADRLTLSAALMTIRYDGMKRASACVEITLGQIIEEPREVGFNARYLADLLKTFDGGNVVFHFYSTNGPCNFVGANDRNGKDNHMTWTLMPARV